MKPTNLRAIAVDLDGTLLDSNKCVSPANREALRRCLDAGVPVFPATSRPLRSTRILLHDTDIVPGPGVFLGGSFAIGPDGAVCVDKSIPMETLADTLELIEHHAPGAWITIETGSDEWYSNRQIPPEKLQELGPEILRTYGHPEIIGTDRLRNQRAGKVIVSCGGKSLEGTCSALIEQFGDSLSYVLTIGGEWLELLPEDTGKERALEVLLGCSGISINDCAAFGDGSNDVTFLAGCGISIAMANAVPKCLEVATYITKTNDEDGFAWAVSEILEI